MPSPHGLVRGPAVLAEYQPPAVLQDPPHAFERRENIRDCAQRVRHEHSVYALAFEGNALALQCRIRTGFAFDPPICYATSDRK